MSQNWKTYKLGDLISINSNNLKRGQYDWINYIDIKSVSTGIYGEPTFYEIGSEPSRAKRVLKDGDTVISSVRPNLKAFFYCQDLPKNAIASTGFAVLSPDNIDARFLYYLTTNDNYVEYLVKSCTGSAYPAFNPSVILDSTVTIPESIEEQTAIASILSALDDKIELNLQMNKTLEEMAMALYKHWFVDFGPFKDGEFVESELGMIPKGWEVKRLGEVFDTTSGGTPSRSKEDYYLNGEIPWIKSKELYGDFVIEAEEKISELGLKNSSAKLIQKGSILLAMYGNTVGVSSILSIDAACNQAICAISEKNLSNIYLYLFLKINKSAILNLAVGSAQQNISQQIIKQIQILVPPKDNKCFNEIELCYSKIEQNLIENKVLTVKRDSLLPKLISGEIKILNR